MVTVLKDRKLILQHLVNIELKGTCIFSHTSRSTHAHRDRNRVREWLRMAVGYSYTVVLMYHMYHMYHMYSRTHEPFNVKAKVKSLKV